MDDKKQYKLDFEGISNGFKFKENGLTHSQGNKFKLLPYAANEKTLVLDFSGVIGAFSRAVSDKKLKEEINFNELVEKITESVENFQEPSDREVFKDIVRTMFISKEKLIDFHVRIINYISSTNADEKVANFLYCVLFDERLKEKVINYYDGVPKNVLHKLILNKLPKLESKKYLFDNYKCYLPFVKNIFIKDFEFLIGNQQLYKNSLKRVLEYYYMFYVSQLSIKLAEFEKADLNEPEKVYFTLSWESTSKNRTAYKFGWEILKNSISTLFSHAITLEFLNYHGLDNQLGYVELFNLFKNSDEENITKDIEYLCKIYMDKTKEGIDWNDFSFKQIESGSIAFNKVYELYEIIKYQFEKSSTRARANEAYKNWFIKFVYENFAKKRGSLGYNLNLTEEDIILMTKLCIGKSQRLKLIELFYEFEKRGMFFDKDSKTKIVQLYEKMNLLEKKSDSGDAQYVRSIL